MQMVGGSTYRSAASHVLGGLTVLAYCAAMGAILSHDAVHESLGQHPLVLAAIGVHLLLGLGVGRWWALGLSAFPLAWPLVFPGSMPPDPDITDYPAMVSLLAMMALPLTIGLTVVGVWLRGRLRGRLRAGARSARRSRRQRTAS